MSQKKYSYIEAVAMLTITGSETFPFCYMIYDRNAIIIELIGGKETTKCAPILSAAKINGFTVSRLKIIIQKNI